MNYKAAIAYLLLVGYIEISEQTCLTKTEPTTTTITTTTTTPITVTMRTTTIRTGGGKNDIHMTSIDGENFEFQYLGNYYLMYSDNDQIKVTEGLTQCNYGYKSASCGCAIHFHYNDTSIIMDSCGVAATPQTLSFYSYTTAYDSFTLVDCASKVVSTVNRFNDAWWTEKGNAVEVGQNKFLCAVNNEDGYFYLRTNNRDQTKNAYVFLTVASDWSGGIMASWVRPSPASYNNTAGVIGSWDGNPTNDHFILQEQTDQDSKKVIKTVPSDINTVAAFWRLRTISQFDANTLTRRDCPFDINFQTTPNTQDCMVLPAQGIQQYLKNPFRLQDYLRPAAKPLSDNEATRVCTEGLAKAKDGLNEVQYANALVNCILDMTLTGDNLWLEENVRLANAIVVQNRAGQPTNDKDN